jgi:hypothetical protein
MIPVIYRHYAKAGGAMQSTATTGTVTAPSTEQRGISVDGIRLLTGALGILFLTVGYAYSAAFLAGAAYLLIRQPFGSISFGIAVALIGGASLLSLLTWTITRWIARGILEGRRARAIVASLLMAGFALLGLSSVTMSNMPLAAVGSALALALSSLVLSLLLFASFRNRNYWGRSR